MKIAFCINIEEFNNNQIFIKENALKYIGAYWLYIFKHSNPNFEIVTGDIALDFVQKNIWNPNEIRIIQELNSYHGYQLIKKGAIPFLITCSESPLYAYKFYDNVYNISKNFKYRIFFSGLYENNKFDFGQNFIMKFPNYNHIVNYNKPWENRKDIVLVASNKKIKVKINLPTYINFIQFFNSWLDIVRMIFSKHLRYAKKNELLSMRIEFIQKFSEIFEIYIYGKNWENNFLNFNVKILNSCDDKITTMSNFKYAICFENVQYPGYITEKIIDCFNAGVIPIYKGAPDVLNFIPANTFINVDDFRNFEDIVDYINNTDNEIFMNMVKNGKKFLELNPMYSSKGFSTFVSNLFYIHE
jgi:hypothetical protein